MKKTLLALTLLVSSCVTSGDLREVADSIDQYHAGQITEETLREAIEGVAVEVDERTGNFLEGVSTGNGLIDLIIAGGAAVAGGIATKRAAERSVNKKRDEKRAQRGEPS